MIRGCFCCKTGDRSNSAELAVECLYKDACYDESVTQALTRFCFPFGVEHKHTRLSPEVRFHTTFCVACKCWP